MELWIFHSTDLHRGVIKAIEKGTMETFDHSEREAGKSVASLVGVFLGASGLNQLPRIVWSTNNQFMPLQCSIPMKSFQWFGDHNNKCMASMVWSVINPLLQCQRNSGFRSKQAFQNWCNCPFLHNLQPWAKLVCKIATKSAEFSKSDNVTFLLFLC